jgi:hypothetical protein
MRKDKLKAQAGGKSTIHVYDDAPHAFHADYRPSYRKDHAEDGWKRLLAWFKQMLLQGIVEFAGWPRRSGRRCWQRRASPGRHGWRHEAGKVGAGGTARGQLGDLAFEHRHDREDFVEVLLGKFGHITAAARLEHHQAFGSQHLERLAQRVCG